MYNSASLVPGRTPGATTTHHALIREITHRVDSYSTDNVRSVMLEEDEEGMVRRWRGCIASNGARLRVGERMLWAQWAQLTSIEV